MSNQIYIPPINFNENENFNSSTVSINAIEPLEYNKLNSNLSIKAATENNYGVITTGTQTFKGLKTFSDNLTIYTGSILTEPTNDTDISNKKYVDTKDQELKNLIGDTNEKAIVLTGFQRWYYGTDQYNFNTYVSKYKNKYVLKFGIGEYIKSKTSTYESDAIFLSFEGLKGGEFENLYSYMPNSFTLKAKQKKDSNYINIEAEFEKGTLTYNEITYQGFRMLTKAVGNGFNNLEVKYIDCYFNNSDLSNINKINCSTLKVSDNYINKIPVSIMVRTRGSAGTFDKDITIYKTILNGKTSIIFNKNLDFNSYSNTSDASISKNSMIINMTNLSDIFGYLPYEIELTGETSTYGGTKNIATRTLKFKKSPADPYKYDLQYDQSFPFNIFKLKDTIKNTDTIINTTEIQKINTLTIDKGYLYNTPTEANNLVNKNYVDAKADEINSSISDSISKISSVTLTTGTISTTPSAANDIANKKYVDYSLIDFETITDNKINSKIGEALSNLSTVNLTTGTISTAPTNDTDIANKKYIETVKTELNGNITTAINNIKSVNLTSGTISTDPTNNTDITNKLYIDTSINSFKSYSDSNFIKYDSGSSKLIKSSPDAVQQITNLNLSDLQITNKITIDKNVMDLQNFSMCPIENSSGSVLRLGTMNFLKIKVNNTIYLSIRLSFEPFVSSGGSLYIKNVELSDIGTSYQDYITYYCIVDTLFKFGRCTFKVTKNIEGKYDIEISGTANGDNIYKFDAFNVVYYLN